VLLLLVQAALSRLVDRGCDRVGARRAHGLVAARSAAPRFVGRIRRSLQTDSLLPRDTERAMSQENLELVRRLYAELFSGGSAAEFKERLTDDALSAFLDPGVEWITVPESLLAVDRYVGFDGVRRFWGEFVSAWEDYRVEPLTLRDAGDQVAVVVHIVGRTHGTEVDGTRSSLLTVRDGKVVRVQAFADPDAALEAAGLEE
jgi:ketosteroid isomerase-like protein